MGSRTQTIPRIPPVEAGAASQAPGAAFNGGIDPAAAPASGYDALAESRKRIAAAANRRSLFTGSGAATSPVLGAS
jgi:hypothetical protein